MTIGGITYDFGDFSTSFIPPKVELIANPVVFPIVKIKNIAKDMRLIDSGHGLFFNIVDNKGKVIISDRVPVNRGDPNDYRPATPYTLRKP